MRKKIIEAITNRTEIDVTISVDNNNGISCSFIPEYMDDNDDNIVIYYASGEFVLDVNAMQYDETDNSFYKVHNGILITVRF